MAPELSEKESAFLEYVRPITWQEVFDAWRAGEAHQPMWQTHWVERGFDSWDAWRREYAAPIKPEERKWHLYRLKDPLRIAQDLYGVPSRGWSAKCYGGERTKRLGDVLDQPTVCENWKIDEIADDFPEKTMLTGIVHDGKIIVIEGMHRACALARLAVRGTQDFHSEVMIALADHPEGIPALGKGDEKNERV